MKNGSTSSLSPGAGSSTDSSSPLSTGSVRRGLQQANYWSRLVESEEEEEEVGQSEGLDIPWPKMRAVVNPPC